MENYRHSPFPSLLTTSRVFAKAVILLLVLNFLCIRAELDPIAILVRFNTWWLVGHGRNRLLYPGDFYYGELPVEALLASHALAYTPKAADEYRVVVLGDSTVMGWGLADGDTFSEQLTARGLRIGGRRVTAYNLAYPGPNAALSALILEAAMRYQPDLVIWCVTANTFNDIVRDSSEPQARSNNLNRAALKRFTDIFGMQNWFARHMPPGPFEASWLAVHNSNLLPVWLTSLTYPWLIQQVSPSLTRMIDAPIPDKARIYIGAPGFEQMPNESWNFLRISHAIAAKSGTGLLLVNEPILIGRGPNSQVNYNSMFERALYDNYRAVLADYARQNDIWFVDLWDLVPPEHFTDTILHMDGLGNGLLAARIAQILADAAAAYSSP